MYVSKNNNVAWVLATSIQANVSGSTQATGACDEDFIVVVTPKEEYVIQNKVKFVSSVQEINPLASAKLVLGTQ